MFKRLACASALTVLLAACAAGPPPAPPAPPPLDPTGTWDVMFDAEGMTIGGVMVIEGSAEEGYTGSLDTDMGGAAIADINVDGQIMTFTIPEASASVTLEFDGDEFTGSMSGVMGEAALYGQRVGG